MRKLLYQYNTLTNLLKLDRLLLYFFVSLLQSFSISVSPGKLVCWLHQIVGRLLRNIKKLYNSIPLNTFHLWKEMKFLRHFIQWDILLQSLVLLMMLQAFFVLAGACRHFRWVHAVFALMLYRLHAGYYDLNNIILYNINIDKIVFYM